MLLSLLLPAIAQAQLDDLVRRASRAAFDELAGQAAALALLPPTMTRRDLRAGWLVPVLPQYHRKGHGLNLLYPSRRHLPLAVSAFIGLVIEKLGAVEELPTPPPCPRVE